MFATAGLCVIRRHPVDARDDAGETVPLPLQSSTRTAYSFTAFATPYVDSTHRAGDVRAVPGAVVGAVAVVHRREDAARATAELDVRRADPRVDDVHVHAAARGVVRVAAVEREIRLVDPIESPRRVVLRRDGRHDLVGFDHRDVGVVLQRRDRRGRQRGREAVDRVHVRELELAALAPRRAPSRVRACRSRGSGTRRCNGPTSVRR